MLRSLLALFCAIFLCGETFAGTGWLYENSEPLTEQVGIKARPHLRKDSEIHLVQTGVFRDQGQERKVTFIRADDKTGTAEFLVLSEVGKVLWRRTFSHQVSGFPSWDSIDEKTPLVFGYASGISTGLVWEVFVWEEGKIVGPVFMTKGLKVGQYKFLDIDGDGSKELIVPDDIAEGIFDYSREEKTFKADLDHPEYWQAKIDPMMKALREPAEKPWENIHLIPKLNNYFLLRGGTEGRSEFVRLAVRWLDRGIKSMEGETGGGEQVRLRYMSLRIKVKRLMERPSEARFLSSYDRFMAAYWNDAEPWY